MAHEMIEEGKLASEKQKNIQAAAEFWADMRKTDGFQNQPADLNVQVAAMTEEAAREPGSSSKQQVEAPFESRENPKRRKRSDDEYKTPTIHRLSNTAPPGEYTKPVTTTISLGNTPASGGEDEALMTASETRTAQALDAIPVEPVKRTGEHADKFAEPITTTANQRDNVGMTSLTAIEEETHKPQTQTGSTDEVWQSHSNRKRDKIPHSPTSGTYSKQQVRTSIDNLGNRKRKEGSDEELQHPSTLLLDTTIQWPVKRSRFLTGEYVKPTTTSSRNAAPATEVESHKPQTQTGSTDEVWLSHRNPKSDKVPNSPTTGTSSKQHVEILMKNLGNRKRKGGSNDEHSRPTTAGDDTTSPTTIEEGTHNLQTQTASTGEVWRSQRNPKSNETPHSQTPGTSSKQQIEALKETLGNRKRKRGSDDELPHPTTLLLDTIFPWPAKRDGGFANAYTEPKTTTTHQDDTPASGSWNAASSLTRDEAKKSVLAENAPTPTNYGVLVGKDTIALTQIEGHFTATPHTDTPKKYKKPRSGSKTKQKQSRPKGH
jgi:hypothetical protein